MWQSALLRQLKDILEHDDAVLAIRPFGSTVDGVPDAWSDLDVELTVRAEPFDRFLSSVSWLEPVGEICVMVQRDSPEATTLRIVFRDLRCLDLRIVRPGVDQSSSQGTEPVDLADQLTAMTTNFVFDAFLAIHKLVRNDLLIGAHLTFDLERTVLVLAMMLRDQVTGTTVHRRGGPMNDLAQRIAGGGVDAKSLLARIGQAIDAFDDLATRLDQSWHHDWSPLRAQLHRAVGDI